MWEYDKKLCKLYLHTDGPIFHDYSKKEIFGNKIIYTINQEKNSFESNFNIKNEEQDQKLEIFSCKKCSSNINYKILGYLPSNNWQLNIDLWTCHSEHKNFLPRKVKCRDKLILSSSFYFIGLNIFNCSCLKDEKDIFFKKLI